MFQSELLPNVLKKGMQKIRFELEGDCLGKEVSQNDFDLRLAGFKVGEMPAGTFGDTKVKGPFGRSMA